MICKFLDKIREWFIWEICRYGSLRYIAYKNKQIDKNLHDIFTHITRSRYYTIDMKTKKMKKNEALIKQTRQKLNQLYASQEKLRNNIKYFKEILKILE